VCWDALLNASVLNVMRAVPEQPITPVALAITHHTVSARDNARRERRLIVDGHARVHCDRSSA
jgi:hypothetical protein